MKKMYQNPELELVLFTDVIVTSDGYGDSYTGGPDVEGPEGMEVFASEVITS